MDSESSSPEKLIQRIHSFLKQEQEMYGAFSLENRPNNEGTDDESEEEYKIEVQHPVAGSGTSSEPAPVDPPEDRGIEERIEACTTLDELQALCAEADELRTDLEDTNLVFGVGNPDADLVIIGEAPGEEEDRQGEPFVGKAGQLLNKILAAIDFSREDVYIANILKHRPPNNRDPKPGERQRSLPFLLKQIDLINPKLILSLGKVSAQTLLDTNQTLGRMRGTFHPFHGKYELLATYHPAALLRHEKWKRPTWEDVQMLRKRYDELGGKP